MDAMPRGNSAPGRFRLRRRELGEVASESARLWLLRVTNEKPAGSPPSTARSEAARE